MKPPRVARSWPPPPMPIGESRWQRRARMGASPKRWQRPTALAGLTGLTAVALALLAGAAWLAWDGFLSEAPVRLHPDAVGPSNRSPWAQAATATAVAEASADRPPPTDTTTLAQWQALLAAEWVRDAQQAWRHALQLAALRPAWAEALVQPLLEPLWQRREFEGMLNSLDQTPGLPAQWRDTWASATLSQWTHFAPAQAAAWASARAQRAMPGAAEALVAVNDRWAHQDARSATMFASTLPGITGQALLTESLSRWLALDGTAARSWIRTQGTNGSLDAAIALHATQDELARQSPQEAIELVRHIADPARRQQAQWALAQTLRDIDPNRQDLLDQALQGAGPTPMEPLP
ncbi:hypothetical protein OU995_20090 [Roseateles sp. SL47]|uniref:hypothetical protein n=1 Tax=Roseateles sp. SL47 TaxID=2995138 RepID=UPI002271AC5D|nr:hypothetical protein [Roseateles sp. SL47]WAC71866.1 hypothetical protein OU995_20090 [Roseateles sp. SL47]